MTQTELHIKLVQATGGDWETRRSNFIRLEGSNCCELGLCDGQLNQELVKRLKGVIGS